MISILCTVISGCASTTNFTKVDAGKLNQVCIVENKPITATILDAIKESLANHGIRYRLISGSYEYRNNRIGSFQEDQLTGCDAALFYNARWQALNVMHESFSSAEIWLTTPDHQYKVLGDASYDANLSLKTWINEHDKILEMVDGLFEQYKKVILQNVDNNSQNGSKVNGEDVGKSEISLRLRELQQLKNEGLISDEDYQRKKQQLLDQL